MLRDSLPKIKTELPGPLSRKVIEKRNQAIPTSIACGTPYAIDRGEGYMVQDLDGNYHGLGRWYRRPQHRPQQS